MPRRNRRSAKDRRSARERRFDRMAEKQQAYEKNSDTRTSSAPQFSADDLLSRAEDLISQFQFGAAQQFLERALTLDDSHPLALTLYGDLLLHTGDIEGAVQALRQAIQVQPDEGVEKYMNYGQAVGGDEALSSYRKGIQLLEELLEGETDADLISQLRLALCSAYCSIAELYLTDLCMVPEAEEVCGAAITKALEFDETSAVALLLAASYKISCKLPSEAHELLETSYAQWKNILHSKDNDDEDDNDSNDSSEEERGLAGLSDDQLAALPTYEQRLETARLFCELQQYTTAIEICEQLVTESDDIVDVWCVMARAHEAEKQYQDAANCLQSAKNLLKRVVDPDPQMEAFVDDMHEQIKQHLDNE